MLFFTYLILSPIACIPDWVDTKPQAETDSTTEATQPVPAEEYDSATIQDTSIDNTEDNEDSSNSHNDDIEENDDTEPNSPTVQITSGTWILAESSVVSDPCDWNSYVETYGVDFTAFLPTSFNVNAEAGQFGIKANNFGARDTITCTIDDQDFSCTLQTVDSQSVTTFEDGRGWPRYWVYEISFEGRIIDEDNLIGVASVEFPSVNPGDAWAIGIYGMSLAECGQAYELTLVSQNAN